MRSRSFVAAVSLTLTLIIAMAAGATPALAETHPFLLSFGSFTDPNGIAIDEFNGDVYVADIATNTVQKFDANGNPVEFASLKSNTLTGGATPAKSFSFPSVADTPAAIAVDDSASASDPSAGDLYVLDAGHDAIDKFAPSGEYRGSLTGLGAEILGLGVDASGNVRVEEPGPSGTLATLLFDSSEPNDLIQPFSESQFGFTGGLDRGFAVDAAGDGYALLSGCGCASMFSPHLEPYGRVDSSGLSDVAVAVDRATGHVYVDDQSSVAEWDPGDMDGRTFSGIGTAESEETNSGMLVGPSFGSLQLSSFSGQGGIAVNGASGEIYVSNPADGRVYVFGTTAPGVAARVPMGVSETGATLQGAVDPHGAPVVACRFAYGTSSSYGQSVPCAQTAAEIGSGSSPVPVSAAIGGLQPGILYHFRLEASNANGGSSSSGIFPTVGPGFGFKSLEVAVLNRDGSPDVQAGSHPYEMITNFAFNTTVLPKSADPHALYVPEPDGSLKDLITNLPPGLIADPNATTKKCTLKELSPPSHPKVAECPAESQVGVLEAEYLEGIQDLSDLKGDVQHITEPVFSMVPPPGVAFQLGAHFKGPNVFIDAGVPAGGNSGARATVTDAPTVVPVISSRLTLFGGPPPGSSRPLITLPTACNGPLTATISADSYQNPGRFANAGTVTRDAVGAPTGMSGCAQLLFPPAITVTPDLPDASSPSGLTVRVHVSQNAALNPEGLAESALRDTTVTLPAGVAINPAGANGLEACSESLAGFTGFAEFNPNFEAGDQTATFTSELPEPLQPGANFCPNGSRIGNVKLKTPLLPNPLEGGVYLAAQEANPFGSLIAIYMIIEDPVSGTLVKLAGQVTLCENVGQVVDGVSCQAPGQIVTTFKNTPELPFEDLEVHFFGGQRAPLTTPSQCGTYTTNASFTPWDGNGPTSTSSSFQTTSGPNGSACPGASLPFAPSLTAGSTNLQAAAFTPFTTTFSREDGNQNLSAVQLHLPEGLLGKLASVTPCPEPQASQGACGPASEIGHTVVGVGLGSEPYTVTGGRVFITGPYKGAPYGLSIAEPAKAGPFDLGSGPCDCVVVRSRIEVDRQTSALTVVSDPLPTMLRGIPLQLKHVSVTVDRPGFTFNPTNCNQLTISATLAGEQGATASASVPFEVANCATLPFNPKFTALAQAKTSKANGVYLHVKVVSGAGQANIAKVKVDLPVQLPSRLSTLQKACVAAVFEANPASCPAASVVGTGTAVTPVLKSVLTGPAYLVSHGGAKFPDLEIVLQGEGITLVLVGNTDIKKGITSSTFKSVPDAPISTFDLVLSVGPHSVLAAYLPVKAKGSMCGQSLAMPTAITGQNGAVVKQTTKIAVSGCPKHKKVRKQAKKVGAKHMRGAKEKG